VSFARFAIPYVDLRGRTLIDSPLSFGLFVLLIPVTLDFFWVSTAACLPEPIRCGPPKFPAPSYPPSEPVLENEQQIPLNHWLPSLSGKGLTLPTKTVFLVPDAAPVASIRHPNRVPYFRVTFSRKFFSRHSFLRIPSHRRFVHLPV